MKKRFAFSSLLLIISLIVSIAVLCPVQSFSKYEITESPILTLDSSDIVKANDCTVSSDGLITMTGEDPFITFNGIGKESAFVSISSKIAFDETEVVQLYYDYGEGLSEDHSMTLPSTSGEKSINYALGKNNYRSIRVDFTYDSENEENNHFSLDKIDFYKDIPTIITTKSTVPAIRYLIAVIISLGVAGAAFLIDLKAKVSDRIINYFKENYKKLLINTAICCGAVIASALIELVISLIFAGGFNIYRFIFIASVAVIVCLFVLLKNDFEGKPEKAFLSILLTAGTMMIFTAPFGHIGFDIDSHYRWALGASYAGDANVSYADYRVMNLDFWPRGTAGDNAALINSMNEADKTFVTTEKIDTTVAHCFGGAIIAVVRMFGGSFYQKYILGEFGNLIIYSIVCYLAMKRLKSGKMILAVIALFPTNLFLATTYSYDYWVTAFSMLGMAYFISEMQQPDKPLKVSDTIIMCGAFAISSLPKLIYMPLLVIPFFMQKNNIKNKQKLKFFSICAAVIAVTFVLLIMRSLVTTGGSGDLRGGNVNPSEQIKYILSDPIGYAKTAYDHLKWFLAVYNMKFFMTYFAYYGMSSGYCLVTLLMFFTAFTDKSDCDKFKHSALLRIICICLYFGIFVLVVTAMYISFSPVGATSIEGIQPRYVIPLLYPLLAVLSPSGLVRIKNRKYYNMMILGLMALVIWFDIYTTYLPRVLSPLA